MAPPLNRLDGLEPARRLRQAVERAAQSQERAREAARQLYQPPAPAPATPEGGKQS
jgi:hypothetical protein